MSARNTRDRKRKIRYGVEALTALLVSLLLIGSIYIQAQPRTYDLEPGDVAEEDIVTTRPVADRRATEAAAEQAASQTPDVMIRSQGISEDAVSRVVTLFELTDHTRASLYPKSAKIFREMLLRQERGETGEEDAADASEPTAPPDDAREAGRHGKAPAAGLVGRGEPRESETTAPSDLDDPVPTPVTDEGITALGEQADRLFHLERWNRPDLTARAEWLATQSDVIAALPTETVAKLLDMPPSVYFSVRLHTLNLATHIMGGRHDATALSRTIDSLAAGLVERNAYYEEEMAVIPEVLHSYLRANMVYDEAATATAREAVRRQVLADPVMLEAGTRIVTAGEIITPAQYRVLEELDLLNTHEINFSFLGGIALIYTILTGLLFFYLYFYERTSIRTVADRVIILVSILLVFYVSLYVSSIHGLLPPIAFITVIAAVYFGFRTAMVLSLYMVILVYPMGLADAKFLVTALVTAILINLVMSRQARRSSYAPTIVAGIFGSFLAAAAYGLIAGDSLYRLLTDAAMAALSAGVSVIAAVGIMPIFEIFLSAASPVKLITLAQPSQPLLQRLFIEAPGTYQHSMMVANLAEAAAQQIGANALLIRVGAYYHDIGKLENPLMFTENQQGYNPHDYLPPEESVRVIMRHVSTGLKVAQRYRLPRAIRAMIVEHHGTTTLIHFYNKAKANAEAEGLPPPNIEDYRYPWHKPQSKETGILMLADTMEAAMKSTGISNVEDAETLARRLVKGKNDQDQLVESGLSFNEVETIIQAFIQVYAGQFHERVKYPDASSTPQTAR